jgi:hypothetical protein
MIRGVVPVAVVVIVGALISGCVGAVPKSSQTPDSVQASPTPTATATATPVAKPPVSPAPVRRALAPLMTISGSVADASGQSLTVTMVVVDVQPLTEQDTKAVADAYCTTPDQVETLAGADGRMVTMSVEAVGTPGFTTWADDRGVRVTGTLYSGSMWREEAHSPISTCVPTSVIVEPGLGSTRMFVSGNDWKVPKPLPADGAVTLATYGFDAQAVDALGRPTGTSVVEGCTITTSPELDALVVATAPDVQWGSNVPLPEYCFIGRNPSGD